MLAGAVGTAAGMIGSQSEHTALKFPKTIENANIYNHINNFALNADTDQTQNSFQTLNNTTLPKNFFSQSQLNQISNIISKQTYHIQGNAFATVSPEQIKKVNQFMHSVQKDVINHIQKHGLQKNGLTNVLVNKYHVSKLWLETEANSENFKSNLKFYKIELQQKINKLNDEFAKINIKNVNACSFNNDYIVQGLNLSKNEESYISQFSLNSNLKSQAKNLLKSINDEYQWMLNYQSKFWNADILYQQFQNLVLQMQNLYNTQLNENNKSELEQSINELNFEINKINNANINYFGFNQNYINLAKKCQKKKINLLAFFHKIRK